MSETAPLNQLAARGNAEFPNLLAAREHTATEVEDRRERLASLRHEDDVAVVLMGSWGRAELTSGSDDDFMVLVHGQRREEVRPSIDEVSAILGKHGRPPGPEAVFGQVVYSEELRENIGLDRDNNANLTRRMLLVLESVAGSGEPAWREARTDILAGYLTAAIKDNRPPRFFLNDTVRYWRTIAVDFEGKDRDRLGRGWGVRNTKLRTSRKLLFASGLIPILACHGYTAAEMPAFLRNQFEMPPSDRLAYAFLQYDAVDAGVRTLGAYDRFLGRLDDAQFRGGLEALQADQATGSAEFDEVRQLGNEFQAGLLALLFENAHLAPLVREYAIF